MKALLLSAGYGRRIANLTKKTPKCLLKINNKPILQIWIEQLIKNNVEEIIINTHYLHQKVNDFIKKKKFKIKITLVYEKELLGTAGTLIKNMELYEDHDLLVIHADNYFPKGLDMFIKAHYQTEKNILFSILCFETLYPKECGIVEFDKNNILKKIHEKVNNPPSNIANGAIYLIKNSSLRTINKKFNKAKDFIKDIIPFFYNKIYIFKTNEKLTDIGSYDNLKIAKSFSNFIKKNK